MIYCVSGRRVASSLHFVPHSPPAFNFHNYNIGVTMNSATIAVHWHDDGQPVYSVSFEPSDGHLLSTRLATAGGDNNVRIWHVKYGSLASLDETSVEYLSTLRKHTQAVNAVRFDPSGEILATAGDDGMLILWTRSDHIILEFGHADDDLKESWTVKLLHNTQLEIYDVCWSPDSKYIATGSMDNITKIYSVASGQKLCELADHSHYVQGVAWDPLNEYLATQGADRALHIYSLKKSAGDPPLLLLPTLFFKVLRAEVPTSKLLTPGYTPSVLAKEEVLSSTEGSPRSPPSSVKLMSPPSQKHVHHVSTSPKRKSLPSESLAAVVPSSVKGIKRLKRSSLLYHSETLQSFFRRLTFSPDGTLLLTPLGIYKNEDTADDKDTPESTCLNTVYIYIRSGLNRPPVCHLPGLPKPAVAISFNPIIFELAESKLLPVFKLPYKMVFAVATQDSVLIYDTQSLRPIGSLTNLHYLTITDLCWDYDGQKIIISSAEGFCSVVAFEEGKFGKRYNQAAIKSSHKVEASKSMDVTCQLGKKHQDAPEVYETLKDHYKTSIASNTTQKNLTTAKSLVVTPSTETSHPASPAEKVVDKIKILAGNSQETIIVSGEPPAVLNNEPPVKTSTPVTPSLLSKFIAEPVVVGAPVGSTENSLKADAKSTELSDAALQKKRRIVPTLVKSE